MADRPAYPAFVSSRATRAARGGCSPRPQTPRLRNLHLEPRGERGGRRCVRPCASGLPPDRDVPLVPAPARHRRLLRRRLGPHMSDDDKKPFHNPFGALRDKLRDLPAGPAPAPSLAPKGPARAVVRMERKGRRGKEVTVVE